MSNPRNNNGSSFDVEAKHNKDSVDNPNSNRYDSEDEQEAESNYFEIHSHKETDSNNLRTFIIETNPDDTNNVYYKNYSELRKKHTKNNDPKAQDMAEEVLKTLSKPIVDFDKLKQQLILFCDCAILRNLHKENPQGRLATFFRRGDSKQIETDRLAISLSLLDLRKKLIECENKSELLNCIYDSLEKTKYIKKNLVSRN